MNLFSAMLSALAAALIYACCAVFYRLFLSPISAFPGPKLAAATFWYEFYYDIILGGKYIWKIKALHEQYGPVIRINPEELHVVDPAFWDVMYTTSTNTNRRDKPAWQAKGTGIPLSMIGAVPHALHRARRAALSPFFSMQNIRRLLPRIQERVSRPAKSSSCGELRYMPVILETTCPVPHGIALLINCADLHVT